MYLLSSAISQQARDEFKILIITGPEIGDEFFAKFGPGNVPNFTNRPFERFSDYEELLSMLQKDDPQKYLEIHKGVPYYFLAWTAFDMRNYGKALFYMDAAISEDIRKDSVSWMSNPASKFITLEAPDEQVAQRIIPTFREQLDKQLKRFNLISGQTAITIDDFMGKFVRELVRDSSKRSIITAFYTFILEFDERYTDLLLRSQRGGSIEPFLTHLFKGGLIFESLLKHLYPYKAVDKAVKTLGEVYYKTTFMTDFRTPILTSANNLQVILDNIRCDDMQTAFDTVSQLRNTTGHNLVWADVFNIPSNYQKFFEQQVNAILYVISKKFL